MHTPFFENWRRSSVLVIWLPFDEPTPCLVDIPALDSALHPVVACGSVRLPVDVHTALGLPGTPVHLRGGLPMRLEQIAHVALEDLPVSGRRRL